MTSEVKVETSGMDEHFEATAVKFSIQLARENFNTQDQKAKYIVKQLEREHGQHWACFVEPVKQFV